MSETFRAIRLRRTGKHSLTHVFARNSGKINLAMFFTLVAIFGTITPGVMLLDFSSVSVGDGSQDVRGNLVCEVEDVVSCHVENAQGFDHIVVTSGDEVVATADEPPFAFEVHRDELEETRTGKELRAIIETKRARQ